MDAAARAAVDGAVEPENENQALLAAKPPRARAGVKPKAAAKPTRSESAEEGEVINQSLVRWAHLLGIESATFVRIHA